MRFSTPFLVLCGGLALAACGDDTSTSGTAGGGGGSGGGGTTATTSSGGVTSSTSSGASTATASSTASTSSGDQGGGGAGQGGDGTGGDGGNGTGGDGGNGTGGDGGNGTGGDGTGGDGTGGNGTGGGGTGGGENVCPDIPVEDQSDDFCELDEDLATPVEDDAPCAGLVDDWPAQIFQITVAEGDCVAVHADNAGSLGADLFAVISDPVGANNIFDDEFDCAVENPDGFLCPEGALTMSAAGDAFIMVGAYQDEDQTVCPDGDSTPYQLTASINGVDVDLSAGPVCTGDLFVIIP